jgi:hypothetical protein
MSLLKHIFAKLFVNVMFVSINKQLKSFQNCFGLLPKLCERKVRILILISNASAGKITLSRATRFTRTRVEWVVVVKAFQ